MSLPLKDSNVVTGVFGDPAAAGVPRRQPFHVTPDPAMVFPHRRYQEAQAAVRYGIETGKGFCVITGEVGAGKTTLLRHLLSTLGDEYRCAVIFNTGLSADELLLAIAQDLDAIRSDENPAALSRKDLADRIGEFLIRQFESGRETIIFIDEAQNLTVEALEALRMLSNLETETEKLLQIVLLGQPELAEMLRQNDLRQLRSRVAVTYHLSAMDGAESAAYIRHRLSKAEPAVSVSFTPSACRALHRYSEGIPRILNILCDQAVTAAAAGGQDRVDKEIVDAVIASFEHLDRAAPRPSWTPYILAGALMVASALGYHYAQRAAQPAPVPKRAEPVVVAQPAPQPAAVSPVRKLVTSLGASAPESFDQLRLDALARSAGLTLHRVSIAPAALKKLGMPALLEPENDLLVNEKPAVLSEMTDDRWNFETAEGRTVSLKAPSGPIALSFLTPSRPWMARELKPGMRGDDLLALQKTLAEKGYLTGAPNGYFGKGTAAAIRKIQVEYAIDEPIAISGATALAVYRSE